MDICLFTLEINLIDLTLVENPLHRKSKSHLSKHMLIHSRGKPHKCEPCGNSFTEKDNLSRHMLIHTGDKPYKCERDKKFSQKRNLSAHLYIHTGDKPYRCEAC